MKKMIGFLSGMATVGLVSASIYMMMDTSKKKKVNKVLNNAYDEANKLIKKMDA